jgi:hypothetical protein
LNKVLSIQPVKGIQGNIELPPSPDLLLLGAVVTAASQASARISPLVSTPLTRTWLESLKGQLDITDGGDHWIVGQPSGERPVFITLPYEELPYRDLITFILLGMGLTVAFRTVTQQRIDLWCSRMKELGIILEPSVHDDMKGLRLQSVPEALPDIVLSEESTCAVLGLMLGLRRKGMFRIDVQFSNPLRHIAPLFGHDITVKSTIERASDPIARRLRFMQGRKKNASTQNQQFMVHFDFSPPPAAGPIEIILPGDEILAAMLVVSKCLVNKGSLAIGNMALESWATQILNYIRKMGCKISIQETRRTSFGSSGIVSIQKIEINGRKVECVPLYQHLPHLPSMIVLAAFAEGQSVFRDLEELRGDEPDGIGQLEACIRLLGARHGEMPDGIVMEGARDFDGFDISAALPAHTSGPFAIAGLHCMGTTTINDEYLARRWPSLKTLFDQISEFRT